MTTYIRYSVYMATVALAIIFLFCDADSTATFIAKKAVAATSALSAWALRRYWSTVDKKFWRMTRPEA